MFERLLRIFGKCRHSWRPVAVKRKPGRLCRYCELYESIDEGEFYARFGFHFEQRVESLAVPITGYSPNA